MPAKHKTPEIGLTLAQSCHGSKPWHDLSLATMKLALLFLLVIAFPAHAQSWLRINQLGYLPKATKVAVFVSKGETAPTAFSLCEAASGRVVFSAKVKNYGPYAAFRATARLNFSSFAKPGRYFLQTGGTQSPPFRIGPDVYDGTADFTLKYLRQQRSNYNPFLRDTCHREDGFAIYHPNPAKDSTHLDVSGGWHDASDYLQYLPTSANAVYQLLFAYQHNPTSFGDFFDAGGNPGKNGIPDVLDEAKWGMDWLLKMNPAPGEYYNQLGDDRDHAGMRLPNRDSVRYTTNRAFGFSRPAYLITGEPQGCFRYKNRTKGVASSAGKFASAFALGSDVLAKSYPDFAKNLRQRAVDAFRYGQSKPGTTQTAPGRAPYFYEEDNFVDDMELAAAELHRLKAGPEFLAEATEYGRAEPTTPWMGADTARHYQWYPFVNLGHYRVAADEAGISKQFREFMRLGIEKVVRRGAKNPFLNGVPFIWCSNNLTTNLLTQMHLYRKLTGDGQFEEAEAALRDWLFGCNPWGTSMVVGLPDDGVSPRDPHSAFTHLHHFPIDGGLVDGPVYGSIWKSLIGITLYAPDEFADFQSNVAVYHDDYGDYSTNEPTMDGTACLSYYLSAMQATGNATRSADLWSARASTAPTTGQRYGYPTPQPDGFGAIRRFDPTEKIIRLVFTGHEFADGGLTILQSLKKHGAPASFFLTGEFYRKNAALVQQIKAAGHYLGPHSDRHLLYCDWARRDSTLVSRAQFEADLAANLAELGKAGVSKTGAPWFIPPYEWYNAEVLGWAKTAGVRLLNFTPGTLANADYTTPDAVNYRSSELIFNNILDYETTTPLGLNGFVLLLHVGTDPRRTDKFYDRLDALLMELGRRGYRFGRL